MTVQEYAKDNGFASVWRLKPWRGFSCYEATLPGADGLKPLYTGYPQIILVADGVMRMATFDETLLYMDEVENTD